MKPTVVDVPIDFPFAPANGHSYTDEDRDRGLAQQPITGLELDPSLRPGTFDTLIPPKLVYGWKLGYKNILNLAIERFPDAIQYVECPEELEEDELDPDLPNEKHGDRTIDVPETLFGCNYIAKEIGKHLGMSPPFRIGIQSVFDNDFSREIAITMGDNYYGVVDQPYRSQIQALLSPNEEPKWYLDHEIWQWRSKKRLPLRSGSSISTSTCRDSVTHIRG